MGYQTKPDRRLWPLIVLAVVIIAFMVAVTLAVLGYQPGYISSSSPSTTSGATSSASTASGGGGGGANAVQVVMPSEVQFFHSLNFKPANIVLVIGVNNTITWTNKDTTDHTVTFTNAPSGVQLDPISNFNIDPGKSFTLTLTTPGVYTYHCSFHFAWMHGTIIVKTA